MILTRCDKIFNDRRFTNLQLSVRLKEFIRSVNTDNPSLAATSAWSVKTLHYDMVIKPTSQLRFDCDTSMTRLRRKIDCSFFAHVERKQRAIRRSRIVVVS